MVELIGLPDVVFKHIFSFLTYDEIAKNRLVCTKFNDVGWNLLNQGFVAAEKYQSTSLKAVKALLPRRESERRKHALSKKCDVLVMVETRLSMLSLAFSRFIDIKLCCFIPGKVIDELFRVMRSLDSYSFEKPHASQKILQELRDISTMAIEYFDDKIAPDLRKKEMNAMFSPRNGLFDMPEDGLCTSRIETNKFDFNLGTRATIGTEQIEKLVKKYCARTHQKEMIACRKKVAKYTRLVKEQERKIKELQETINENSARLHSNEAVINDLKRQCDEWKNYCRMQNISKHADTTGDVCSITKREYSNDELQLPAKKKSRFLE